MLPEHRAWRTRSRERIWLHSFLRPQDREFQSPQPCLASRAALYFLVIAALPDAVDDGYWECVLLTVPATDVVLGRLSLLRVAVAFEQLSNLGLHCPPAFLTTLNCPLLTQ